VRAILAAIRRLRRLRYARDHDPCRKTKAARQLRPPR
jgi:hypothetical protein